VGTSDNISLTLLKGFRIGLLNLLQGVRLVGLWTNKQFNNLQRCWGRLGYDNCDEVELNGESGYGICI
jgi:hypothetical protein